MKKILVLIGVVSLLLTGCSSTVAEYKEGTGVFGDTYYTYVDSDTGVNYVVFVSGYKGGICPRYNADGTLYVTPLD